MTGPPWSVEWAGASHAGRVRRVNEDAWLARPEAGIFAVADGMGGHRRGDLASRAVVGALAVVPPCPDARSLRGRVEAALAAANTALRTPAAKEISGSTVVALLLYKRYFAALWAGDSRLYRAGPDGFAQVTRDHSLAQEIVDSGDLAPEAARNHRLSNRITRAVGAAPDLVLEGAQGELKTGDVFLLCSDGLTRHVEDVEIQAALEGLSPRAAADHLLDTTLARGAADNVTAVVLSVRLAEDAPTVEVPASGPMARTDTSRAAQRWGAPASAASPRARNAISRSPKRTVEHAAQKAASPASLR